MGRLPPLVWLLALFLLLPTPVGRALIDVLGGLALVLLALPFILGGLGWIGWKVLQSRMTICPRCGAASLQATPVCAVCGSSFSETDHSQWESSGFEAESTPASSATIDVTAEDVDS
jgi:ribosomal protein L37E